MARRSKLRSGDEHDGRRQSHGPAVFHFFKIILSTTLEQNKLRIPCKFVRKFGNELGDFADLIVPNGSIWKVGLLKAQNNIWFDDGWQRFADHHSIGYGHFLVFAYTGLCSFNVLIFDKTASEVEYPHNNQIPIYKENCGTRNEVEIQDNTPSEVLNSKISSPSSVSFNSKVPEASAMKRDCSERQTKPEDKLPMKRSEGSASMASPYFKLVYTRNKRPKVEFPVEIIDIDDNDTRRNNMGKYKLSELDESEYRSCKTKSLAECEDQETEIISCRMINRFKDSPNSERAMAVAKKYTPKRPSFMVLLREYNYHTGRVYVPNRFYQYLNESPKCIKLQVSDGRQWEAELCRGFNRVDIGFGWNEFVKSNDLQLGDVCVFELTENKEVLEVSIFRAIEAHAKYTEGKKVNNE